MKTISSILKVVKIINCSTNPNYPAGTKNMFWRVSVAGKIDGLQMNSLYN